MSLSTFVFESQAFKNMLSMPLPSLPTVTPFPNIFMWVLLLNDGFWLCLQSLIIDVDEKIHAYLVSDIDVGQLGDSDSMSSLTCWHSHLHFESFRRLIESVLKKYFDQYNRLWGELPSICWCFGFWYWFCLWIGVQHKIYKCLRQSDSQPESPKQTIKTMVVVVDFESS